MARKEPSKAQLDYCEVLGIKVPDGISMADVRALISQEVARKKGHKGTERHEFVMQVKRKGIKRGVVLSHSDHDRKVRVLGIGSRRNVVLVTTLDGKKSSDAFLSPHLSVHPSEDYDIPGNYYPLGSLLAILRLWQSTAADQREKRHFRRLAAQRLPSCETPHGTMYKVEHERELAPILQAAKEQAAVAAWSPKKKKPSRKRYCFWCGVEKPYDGEHLCDACGHLRGRYNKKPPPNKRYCVMCGTEFAYKNRAPYRCKNCLRK